MATVRPKPTGPSRRPRWTVAIPPAAISSKSAYRPITCGSVTRSQRVSRTKHEGRARRRALLSLPLPATSGSVRDVVEVRSERVEEHEEVDDEAARRRLDAAHLLRLRHLLRDHHPHP